MGHSCLCFSIRAFSPKNVKNKRLQTNCCLGGESGGGVYPADTICQEAFCQQIVVQDKEGLLFPCSELNQRVRGAGRLIFLAEYGWIGKTMFLGKLEHLCLDFVVFIFIARVENCKIFIVVKGSVSETPARKMSGVNLKSQRKALQPSAS